MKNETKKAIEELKELTNKELLNAHRYYYDRRYELNIQESIYLDAIQKEMKIRGL